MNSDIIAYYRARAAEYEKIYTRPYDQVDLATATGLLQAAFAGKAVLEIACGTGYWTERIAQTAASVLATDINQAVLDIAETKSYPRQNVVFEAVDLFNLQTERLFDALFGGFIWSHIPLEDLDKFVRAVSRHIRPGGLLVFMDSRYVPGSSTPISETDTWGNTFQIRTLEDRSMHRVLKNFPTEIFLRETMQKRAAEVRVTHLSYFWILESAI